MFKTTNQLPHTCVLPLCIPDLLDHCDLVDYSKPVTFIEHRNLRTKYFNIVTVNMLNKLE